MVEISVRALVAVVASSWLSLTLAQAAAPAASGELLIERTIMPDASPSSFAVGFPNGVSFCYDPVRGGVDYAWNGGFVDPTSVRPGMGKTIKPVTLLGPIVYRENGPGPLRRSAPKRIPAIAFKGYRLHPAAIEFLYTVDGVLVHEEISARPAGDGLVRRFRIEGGDADTRWWYLPGATEGAPLLSSGGQREAEGYRFEAGAAREFTLEIRFPRAQP